MKRLLFPALLFAASSLFAADLSLSMSTFTTVIHAGQHFTGVTVVVHNPGPDTAKDVKVNFTSSVPINCCNFGDVRPSSPAFNLDFVAPATSGTLTITGTVTSSTPDENPANNTVSLTLTVNADPDLDLSLGAPARQDLALPFTLDIYVGNFRSTADAHNVEVTVDYRTDVIITSLPAGCTNPFEGRIVCRAGTIAAGTTALAPLFRIGLRAPEFYGSGSIVFTAVATEDEHDFDPISNAKTLTTVLYKTFYVNSLLDTGFGSLRQAILDSNAQCTNTLCAIAFRLEQGSLTPWKTIHVSAPLPPITTAVRVDGATQSALTGKGNPNGPDIEISGGSSAGDGITVANCGAEIANLAINDFPGNGVSVIDTPPCSAGGANLHHLFVGTDPTGSAARPNLRGIAVSVPNGTQFASGPSGFGAGISIHDSVISGNRRSGIFGLSGRLGVTSNRVGLAAHSDAALPNGNAGVYVGPGCHGADIGINVFGAQSTTNFAQLANTIAFNGQMGVAVDARAQDVAVRHNRIWGNGGLAIDVGLDGEQSSGVAVPVVTVAHYDPVTKQTIIEGDVSRQALSTFAPYIDLYASDHPALSGAGEMQRPLGSVTNLDATNLHFRKVVDGDLTGQFITATATRLFYVGFAKPEPDGIDQGFLTTTSEVSRPMEVR